MIPYGRQEITREDIDAVVGVLQSDFVTQGPTVPAFERGVAEVVGANYGIAVNSATSALHLSCLALELGVGDHLWTTPISFVASANCALYCGAQVDFVDIDPVTYNLSVDALEEKLKFSEKHGRLPKILIPVHLTGQPCNMRKIFELSRRYGFKIIEDASHAIGADYLGEKIGSCRYSDITVFSFHPVKIITTAEGGVAVTNNAEIARRIKLLSSHGITRNPAEMEKLPDGGWYYEQIQLGYNYRMTDIQAALGLSQLKRLEGYIKSRNEIAKFYNQRFEGLPIIRPSNDEESRSSFHLYVIRLQLADMRHTKKEIFQLLRKNNVGVNVHYIPIYEHPFYKKLNFNSSDYPNANRYYEEAISLPIFPTLKESDREYIVKTVERVVLS